MRRCMLGIALILALALLFSGCGAQAGKITVTYVPTTDSPAPAQSPEPEPVSYAIEGQTIVREQGGSKTVIYDVTKQFPDNYDCWLDNLAVEPDVLYFSEGGEPRDTDSYSFALVRTDLDGGNRLELDTGGYGYIQILPYKSRVFCVVDYMSDRGICWADMDGSVTGIIDVPIYPAPDGEEQIIEEATLYTEEDILYAYIGIGDYNFDGFNMEYTIRINDDLSVERVDG